jgi:GNAT superfamily N-acetyltransferase
MEIKIRKALKEDCSKMMELIHELALYEKAPEEVTVDFNHFVESGFGAHPVWQAFVATSPLHSPRRGEGEAPSPLPSPRSGEGEAENEAKIGSENSAAFTLPGYEKKSDMEVLMPGTDLLEGEGDEVVGFALYYIRYSTWKGQRLYLEDLLVTEKLRGKGTGKLLFDRLIEECKEKKYSGMVWQVLDWNEPAINFYNKYNATIDKGWLNCSLGFK